MPYHIETQCCHVSAYVESAADPDSVVTCTGDSPACCSQDHHHGDAASACPGGHGACPTPDKCPVWLGTQPHLPDSNVRDTSAGPCPGGHCGAGVAGCNVCRSIKITLMPGSMTMARAAG